MEELIQSLKVLLANVISFKYRAHGAHWNVEGPDFAEYHALYENIYEDADSSVDPIAENIRKLGDYAPFTLPRLVELRTIQDSSLSNPSPSELTSDLLAANSQLLANLYETFAKATAANSQGIANFIAERIDMHEKWAWQLRSSIKNI